MKDTSGNVIFSQRMLHQMNGYASEHSYDPSSNLISSNIMSSCNCVKNQRRPYYTLLVYLNTADTDLVDKYKNLFPKMQDKTIEYRNGANHCIDAGIDIFTPVEQTVIGLSNKVKTAMKCAMYFNDGTSSLHTPSGFHVYPRSSTGASTPLRLANSVGIIDAGYRGELMGIFDNHSPCEYTIEKYQRVLQICASNLTYPIFPILVDNVDMLDKYVYSNDRGAGGLGSTGL
ncbi:MAG: hypothetical protein WD512_01580 [Candidatus Paceibacterota bacterium]